MAGNKQTKDQSQQNRKKGERYKESLKQRVSSLQKKSPRKTNYLKDTKRISKLTESEVKGET